MEVRDKIIYSKTKYFLTFVGIRDGVSSIKRKNRNVVFCVDDKRYEARELTNLEKVLFLLPHILILFVLSLLFFFLFDHSISYVEIFLYGITFLAGFMNQRSVLIVDKAGGYLFSVSFVWFVVVILVFFIWKKTITFVILSFLCGWFTGSIVFWSDRKVYMTEDGKIFSFLKEEKQSAK